ncbi:MAG TPA: hypothetical protein DCZ91_07000 [Lachnospiraceae bacterium]|nr:hypothetical protein [Lachnospiraceae bacterium]
MFLKVQIYFFTIPMEMSADSSCQYLLSDLRQIILVSIPLLLYAAFCPGFAEALTRYTFTLANVFAREYKIPFSAYPNPGKEGT